MHGEFIGVWSEMWREIWLPLIDESLGENAEGVPEDIFCELYRVLAGDPKRPGALKNTPSVQVLADIIDNPQQSREAFEKIIADDFIDEQALAGFLESTHKELDELYGDELSNRFFNLIDAFIKKFSLRYDLRRPCFLCPTLAGVFISLVRDLQVHTAQDSDLDQKMKDYEESIRDLRNDCSEIRIKTCIQKQVNLLEALGCPNPQGKRKALSTSAKHMDWPHNDVHEALQSLYGFTCDYPGIRHAGTPKNKKRAIDMRDMVATSISLTGFTPYICNGLDAGEIFGGSRLYSGPVTTSAPLSAHPSPINYDNGLRTHLVRIGTGFLDFLRG
ncbi:MAG: hypothetical protein Q7T80_02575 [Methanoregula sp.]|nr:hypothetical protein [Methanoregula sp.]